MGDDQEAREDPAESRSPKCPRCGYESDSGSQIAVVRFDDDLAGVAKLLAPDPLHSPCDVCGAVHRTHLGFLFISSEGVVVAHVPDGVADAAARAMTESISGRAVGLVVESKLADAVRGVRRHLIDLSNELLDGYQSARLEGRGVEWLYGAASEFSRSELSALLTLRPLLHIPPDPRVSTEEVKSQLDLTFDAIFGVSGLRHAELALESDDACGFLDERFPSALTPSGAVAYWEELLVGNVSDDERFATAFLLAWLQDRSDLPMAEATRWIWSAEALRRGDRSSEGGLPVDQGFLRRTVDVDAAVDVIRRTGDAPAALRLRELDLLSPAELVRRLRLSADGRDDADTPAQSASSFVPQGEWSQAELAEIRVDVLTEVGDVAGAVELWRQSLADLAATPEGVAATRAVVEALFRSGQAITAYEIAGDFFEASGDPDLWLRGLPAVHLLNELGNVARKLREFVVAIEHYEQSAEILFDETEAGRVPDEEHDRLLRILGRNYAIVKREQGRPSEARCTLLRLLADATDPNERASVLESLGACYMLLGEYELALMHFEEAIDCLRLGRRIVEGLVTLRLHAAHAAEAAGDDRAAVFAEGALDAATAVGNTVVAATAAALCARIALGRGDAGSGAMVDVALGLIDELATGRLSETPHDESLLLQMRLELLAMSGRVDDLFDRVEEVSEVSWALRGHLAEVRMQRGESPLSDLTMAWSELADVISGDELRLDDISVLRNAAHLQALTVRHAVAEFEAGTGGLGSVVAASELSTNLVASALLVPREDRLAAIGRWQEPDRLLDRVATEEVIVVPIVAGSDVMLVVHRDKSWHVAARWPSGRLAEVAERVAAVTRRGAPFGDPLASSKAWTNLSAEIGEALEPFVTEAQSVVVVDSVGISGLPLHLVPVGGAPLISTCPVHVVGSLLELDTLAGRAIEGRPRRAGVLTVARSGDGESTRGAFEHGAEGLRRVFDDAGLPCDVVEGPEATPEAFASLAASVDVLAISCHGQGISGAGLHGLLLAHGGQLPPLISARPSTRAAHDFLLSWDEIGERTPRVVLSGACSTATASFTRGGERVSLDRALVAGGSSIVVAPMWDISIKQGARLLANVAERVLTEGIRWAEGLHRVISDPSNFYAPATWQSIVVHGYQLGLDGGQDA